MTAHNMPADRVLEELGTDQSSGLSEERAASLLAEHGENRLKGKPPRSMFARFIDQFKDVMILILLGAAVVSFVIACIQGDPEEFFEPVLILVIVILNAILGVVQESRAEKALEALKNMSAPKARVVRQGEEKIIDAAGLVPGDIILLEAGDFVPADARLISSVSLKSEEAALTGESVPAEKDAYAEVKEKSPLGDRVNMVYSGCSVTYGAGRAVVTATGMDTEMGRIANLLEGEGDLQTPLQKKLGKLGKYLGAIALAICAVIFIIGTVNKMEPLKMFMIAVSLAVSAIPEGLPAIVTIVLAIGVQRMAKHNAIIRSLPAVETLGSASVICSDKTGTLTQNRMTLVRAYRDGWNRTEPIQTSNREEIRELIKYASLCCDGAVVVNDGKVTQIGDPTETSILVAALNDGMSKEELGRIYPRIAELPFDSDRKLMTTVNDFGGRKTVIVKGAFDVMAGICTSGDIAAAREACDSMSREALRVLAVAVKEIDEMPGDLRELENNLTFIGLLGMIDPPRPEARDAVAVCKSAGIRPVMITGDHVVTASAIAKDLGILNEGDLAMTGTELDALTERELDETVAKTSVYARVSPENKIRIVKAWQRRGEVVSMTGDGVNDAPALKAADIGCAMGITGTDVAKGAADMTLTDDNFATIVEAVREGRGVYANIRKVVTFLLGTNIGEILTVFVSMLIWQRSPLLSMQLLWINLVTDGLPAVALGMEPIEDGIMKEKPRPKNEGLFAGGLGLRLILQGILFGGLSILGYLIGFNATGTESGGQTLAFMVLALSQIVQSYNMRSSRSLFSIGPFSNGMLNKAALISAALMAVVMFTPLRTPFGLTLLEPKYYLIGLGLVFVPFVVEETYKLISRIAGKKKKKE